MLNEMKYVYEVYKEKSFSKAARTAEKIITAAFHHAINKCSLIYIEIASFTKFLEILDADGIDFVAHNSCFGITMYKNTFLL